MNTQSPPIVFEMQAKLAKKHPNNWGIFVSMMQGGPYATVETDDESINYSLDAAGRLRVSYRRTLNPTEKSVRLQPKDCIIQITGEGPYKGKYVLRQECDGWLQTTDNKEDAPKYRKYDADSIVSRLRFNAQHCYGGKFEIVN